MNKHVVSAEYDGKENSKKSLMSESSQPYFVSAA